MFPLRTNNPVKSFPVFTLLFILINIFFFFRSYFGVYGFEFILRKFGCIPYELIYGRDIEPYVDFPVYFTTITSMFLHGSWWHLLGNIWFLFGFGKNVEDWLGYGRYVLFYLGCGIAASIVQVLLSPLSTIPMVGASGAIAGIMGAYLLLYPMSKIVCYIFPFSILELPAFLFLGFWIIWQIFSSIGGGGGSIAFFAHIGGFFVGLFWVKKMKSNKLRNWR